MKTFKRIFSVDLPAEKAVELTKKSLGEKGYRPADVRQEVSEDFLGQKTRVVTVSTDKG